MMKKIQLLVLVVITLVSCSKKWSENNKREFIKSCTTMSIQNEIPEDKVTDYCYCLLEKTMLRYEEDKWLSEVTTEFVKQSDMSCLIDLGLIEEADTSGNNLEISGGY